MKKSLASCWNGSNAQQRMMNVLSPYMGEAQFAQYIAWMKSRGCNTSHVCLSNLGDGEAAGYCIYGRSWDWTPDPLYVAHMNKRLAVLKENFRDVYGWVFTDDGRAYADAAKQDFRRHLKDLKRMGLLSRLSVVVAGLELNEYYNAKETAALVKAIRGVWTKKIGTHQTSGRYDYSLIPDVQICLYQTHPGKSPAQIKDEARKVCTAVRKPVNFFELSRNPAPALCKAAMDGGCYGVGNI